MLLSHFCKQREDSNFPKAFSKGGDHDGHKPGGLWVGDEESGQGWRDLALKRRREDPANWQYHPELGDIKDDLKFRYDFRIRTDQRGYILEIRNPTELAKFTEAYGEANPRPCLGKYKSGCGFGLHIDWKKVKENFKGILISPFYPKVKEQEKCHWYTFDCASGCFWNTSCIELVGWEETVCEE